MKKTPLLKTGLTAILLMLFIFPARAQLDDLGKLMGYQTDNAQKLFKAYIRPYTNALGTDLSNGWYNTAKPHKTLGFDVTFTLNTTFVPNTDKTFNPENLGLTGIRVEGDAASPTAMGDNSQGARLILEDDFGGTLSEPKEIASFNLPEGTGIGFAPAPMLQVGVGLVKGTEVVGRYIPEMKLGNQAEIGLWGVGIKHSIKQWIPAINKLPILHLSVMGGYTKLSSQTNLSFTPQTYADAGIPYTMGNDLQNWEESGYFAGQSMDLNVQSFSANLIVSANLPVVTFYGGVGINNTKTSLALTGKYPMLGVNQSTGETEITKNSSVSDPFDMEIKHQGGTRTDPRYNIGMRFKFAVITLHFDYTYSNYSVATAGLGLSFR